MKNISAGVGIVKLFQVAGKSSHIMSDVKSSLAFGKHGASNELTSSCWRQARCSRWLSHCSVVPRTDPDPPFWPVKREIRMKI